MALRPARQRISEVSAALGRLKSRSVGRRIWRLSRGGTGAILAANVLRSAGVRECYNERVQQLMTTAGMLGAEL